jgi:hypothetical protein
MYLVSGCAGVGTHPSEKAISGKKRLEGLPKLVQLPAIGVGNPRPLQLLRGTGTSQVWGRFATGCWRYGGVLSAAGARNTGSRGRVLLPWLSAGSRNRARFTPFRMHVLPPFICDCANERSSGSEEGVVRNHDPYSDRQPSC